MFLFVNKGFILCVGKVWRMMSIKSNFSLSLSCMSVFIYICVPIALLDLFCGLFNTSSKAINRVLVSRAVSTVVQGCCMQTDGFHNTLFGFFSKALLNVR